MHRLIVNPGTENAWEIPLASGMTSLGRDADNTFAIEHPSVSGRHCELTVSDAGVVIKDLGSSNGTTVNGALVQETRLSHGQTIQLGDVEMQYEFELPRPTRIAAPAAAPAPIPSTAYCKMHPREPAAFRCPKCGRTFCNICVSPRQGKNFCRACGVECEPFEFVAPEPITDESFFKLALSAFKYPFRGDGPIILGCGGFLFLLVDGMRFLAAMSSIILLLGFIAWILLAVFATGYSTRYLQYVITDTERGKDEMPDWPDMTDFSGEVTSPCFQMLGLIGCCFAPAIGLDIYAMKAQEGGPWLGVAMVAAILYGAIYFPMAFAAVAMFDSLGAVNPLLIVPSILKVPKEYAIAIVMFVVILIVRWFCVKELPELLKIPIILPAIMADFFGLYMLVVITRILGLLCRTKKEELGWSR